MTAPSWTADPLVWGQGPQRFEVFLEPTCPFSGRALGKLWEFLDLADPERVSVLIRLQSQPWHMFSGLITRAILVASTTADGKEAARRVMEAIYANRKVFEFDDHATGPNRDATPDEILRRITNESGVAMEDAFDIPDLDREIKWHCKYAHQNGIHVSPTFMVNGLIAADLGGGDSLAAWAAKLD
ncbi:DsbA family protein [Phaeovulum vinaykumarii]|uniref:Thioredoxin n=1 Tax=Phaeovulum vinaykumarii TaxID=407234 RepID=A0A1N7N6G5_9RHOB|nr:thioredoxin [Phaeovulum vinaykumarii]SIS93987.1 hypothetical protein SAMN05421795_1253 [Phaeovulum vinaykumarii]SOC20413.1 hypothetical protein SAMN05878426_1263 [Phaeovulum vinaykumarii]